MKSSQHPSVFALFLRKYGIVANHSMFGAPEQNVVAKRQNSTLINIVRSKMCDSTFL